MTDSLIPYSFIPGTKAKAQEVNANFIALANSITENTSTLSSSKLNKDLSNITETGLNFIKSNTAPPRNIGEIVTSTVPLTDAGLHLLDGALISGSGSYADFVTYIAGLVTDYPDLFETEANWQSAVTSYDVCGKFVYDSVNNTVRLPKYSNKIYTKNITSTAPVKGNGKSIGLTNGSTSYGLNYLGKASWRGLQGDTGSFNVSLPSTTHTDSFPADYSVIGITTDGTKSGIIADLADITSAVEGYYYIVIATTTKTEVQVDIDDIAVDVNGKADKDLTNCTNAAKSKMAHNAMPSSTYKDLVLGASNATYTAPADGWFYINKVTTGAQYVSIGNNTTGVTYAVDKSGSGSWCTILCEAKKGEVCNVNYTAAGTLNAFRFYYAVGSESEAS